MQLPQIMAELKALGSDSTVKTFRRHGADGDMYGVKVGDLKKLVKHVKGKLELALELWDTNNSDAMYLAALAADGSLMTKSQLDHWAKTAWWHMLSEYSVPFVAAEHVSRFQLGLKWMRSRKPSIATSGWNTYALGIASRPDSELDLGEIQMLLDTVLEKNAAASDRVRYCMNGFVISVGSYVKPMLAAAKACAKELGTVDINMGDTACRVPLASDAIKKIEKMNRVGKKRTATKC